MERQWAAIVAVDASQCATTSGNFQITFSRLKENGLEVDYRETFTWRLPTVNVTVDFWADEAVESYWLNGVAACPCLGADPRQTDLLLCDGAGTTLAR